MASDSVHEWFDALDGAEEFVMDVQSTPDGLEQPSRTLTNESRSSLGQQDTSSVDTDAATDTPYHEEKQAVSPGEPQVVRRTQLPAPPVADEGSLFTILKNNVGKVCIVRNFYSKYWFLSVIGSFYYSIPRYFQRTLNPSSASNRGARVLRYR
jgi:hypothetical protein